MITSFFLFLRKKIEDKIVRRRRKRAEAKAEEQRQQVPKEWDRFIYYDKPKPQSRRR